MNLADKAAKGLALLSCLLFTARQSNQAANGALKKNAWEPLCHLSGELDEIPGDALNRAESAITTANELEIEALRAQAYIAAKPADPDLRKISTLAAYQFINAAGIRKKVQTEMLGKAIEAAAASSYLKGKIDEWLNIAQQTANSGHGCLMDSGNSNSVKLSGTTIDGTVCPLRRSELASISRQPRALTAEGFQNLKTPSSDGGDHQDGSKKCRLMADTDGDGLLKTDSGTSGLKYLDGYITISTGGLAAAQLQFGGTNIKPTAQAAPGWHRAHSSVQSLPASTAAEYSNKTSTLTTDAAAETLFTLIGAPGRPRESTALQAYKTQLFTGSPTDEVKRLMTKVATFKLPSKFGDKAKDTLLGEITEVNVLAALLAEFQLKNSQTLKTLNKKLEEAS
uniref:Variant surface glycoprotein 1125.5059 n=1 Tax=Trypanosoma brucei TaxID=5691 RepID=A0A1J0RBP5_9TRYP|nr:variant surface glycoprotein 1125.5059 [Trypanosoma brucei]